MAVENLWKAGLEPYSDGLRAGQCGKLLFHVEQSERGKPVRNRLSAIQTSLLSRMFHVEHSHPLKPLPSGAAPKSASFGPTRKSTSSRPEQRTALSSVAQWRDPCIPKMFHVEHSRRVSLRPILIISYLQQRLKTPARKPSSISQVAYPA